MSTTLKIIAWAAKIFGLVGTLTAIPGVSPKIAIVIFFAASILKDTLNRVGDFLDNGVVDGSFTATTTTTDAQVKTVETTVVPSVTPPVAK